MRDGKAAGPVSAEELQSLQSTGQIKPGQLVWRQDGDDQIFLHAQDAIRQNKDREKPVPVDDAPAPRSIEYHRQLAQSLQAKVDALQAKISQMNSFLALLSHEMRNPLAPILMGLEAIRKLPADHPDYHAARMLLERQVKKLVRLVGELLDVSRLEHGKLAIAPERVDCRVIVQRAAETARAMIDGHQHQFECALPAESIWLIGDPIRLEQVVVNLLINAAKYTPTAGTIALGLRCETDHAAISVRDTGIGIPPEMQSRIFELFAQADGGRDHAEGGLGVGLALVKTLVDMHAGSVEVRSDGNNQGSEFTVRLPLAPPKA